MGSDEQVRLAGIASDKQAIQNIIDIYRDAWDYIISDALAAQFSPETYKNLYWLTTKELNIVKRVTNTLSMIYKSAPKRYVYTEREEDTENGVESVKVDDDAYLDAIDETRKNVVLKQVNRYTNLCNHTIVKICIRGDKLDHDLMLFNNAEVYTDSKDWTKIQAVKYYCGLKLPSSVVRRQQVTPGKVVIKTDVNEHAWVYSSGRLTLDYQDAVLYVKDDLVNDGQILNGEIKTLKGGKIYRLKADHGGETIVSEDDNLLREDDGSVMLPFVIFDKVFPVDKRFDFDQGNDLIDLNINVAIMMVLLNQVIKYQSFKQPVIITTDRKQIPNPLRLDPAAAIVLESSQRGETSASTIDLEVDIESRLRVIERRILQVLSGYGISPENFTLSASAQSGLAMQISNQGKAEMREDQIDMYRMAENRMFEIERQVWNTFLPAGKKAIDVKAEFAVDFAELEYPKSGQEWAQEKAFLLSRNAISEIDLIKESNPDITDEMAKAKHAENKAINRVSSATLAPLGVANATGKRV